MAGRSDFSPFCAAKLRFDCPRETEPQTLIQSKRRSIDEITIERHLRPSGHSGWLSAHTMEFPDEGDGGGFRVRAFFDRSHLRTSAGWRGSSNHPLNF
jgi:hypothetical protein